MPEASPITFKFIGDGVRIRIESQYILDYFQMCALKGSFSPGSWTVMAKDRGPSDVQLLVLN